MKKLLLIVAAFMVLAIPAANAQKVNVAAFNSKVEKSNAEIKDAKKAVKAATWLNRAKIYSDGIQEPTKSLFVNLPQDMVAMTLGGEPQSVKEDNGAQVLVYPWVEVYVRNRKVEGWVQTKEVCNDGCAMVIEALKKALELDEKSKDKVKQIADGLVQFYANRGSATIVSLDQYEAAARAYLCATELQKLPVYDKVTPDYYFFAGQLFAFLGSKKPELCKEGQECLEKALELGYTEEKGNIYYFLFHCYYGQKLKGQEFVLKAKDALLTGIAKYPKNEKILDGLMQLYTSEEGVGDPNDIVALIDKALAETPDNADLWLGRGRVFFKLKNYDECINCFKKVDELKPNDFDTNYYLGYIIIAKAEAMIDKFNEKASTISSNEEYLAGVKAINDTFAESIPYLEKAHELNPTNYDCCKILKTICFRLRDNAEMKAKYEKYDAELKKLG